jgi:hypothetical protein
MIGLGIHDAYTVCGQTNTTTLISRDREFSGTNGLQIRIQLVRIRRKTYIRIPHNPYLS